MPKLDKAELLVWLGKSERHADHCYGEYSDMPLHGPYYLGYAAAMRDVIAHINGETTAFDRFLDDYAEEEA